MDRPHEKLRMKRCERRISIGKASQLTRISKPTYRRIESGKNPPSLESAYAIERAFGLPMSLWVQRH